MVEAIEDLFVPVLVYNNKDSDAKILASFKEKSWNNPVTRFLKSDGSDVISRKENVWHIQGMASRMVAALKAGNRDVPGYLLAIANNSPTQHKATFAMHCYWEGEGKLGSIPGVSNTLSAWAGGLEVVDVTFDPQKVEYSKLVEIAQSFECASKVFANTKKQLKIAKSLVGNKAVAATEKSRTAKLSDQKYYLRNTPSLRSLPLTLLQSTKVNAALGNKTDAASLLSPRQIELFKRIKKKSAESMSEFVFPEDESKLAEYNKRLLIHLNSSNSK